MFAKKTISRTFSVLFVILFMLSFVPIRPVRAAGIRFATPGGTGDCSDWNHACDLQTALTGATSGDEIWVKAGTYKPTTGTSRYATFQLKDGVALYGGFAGTETARDQRNPAVNVTILSGEIGAAGNSDNSYHVVTGATGATLDGFTITAGNASGDSPNDSGGGLYNEASSPVLANVTFSGNTADSNGLGGLGGGMYNGSNSNPTFTNVTFSGNTAGSGGVGGGMYNEASSPTLTYVTFANNSAGAAGGMYNEASSPTLTNVTFSGNHAESWGGGLANNWDSNPTLMNVTFNDNSANEVSDDYGYGGGGMFNMASSPILTNVTFSGNKAYYGSGMYNDGSHPTMTNVTFRSNSARISGGGMYNSSSNPTLTNVTFNDNSAVISSSGMENVDSNPIIRNTIFWGNTAHYYESLIYNVSGTPIVSNSVVQGGCPAGSTCTNIIITDPKLGPLGNYGGSTKTIPLLPGSSAIDAGNDADCPATDQRGVARTQGAHCDIGAYEDDGTVIDYIYYVKPTASGAGNCSSWANACILQTALSIASYGNEIWATAGTYKPTTGTDRTATFQLKNGVAVYGGFAGTETARDQRDPATSATTLSGDIGAAGNTSDNSYHVVTGATGATLDGVTITAGNANGASPNDSGGGMYNHYSNPTLMNIIFSSNSATYGGGVANDFSKPILMNAMFSGNTATNKGGGMFNVEYSGPTLMDVTFSGNTATDQGGGMANYNNSQASDQKDPILMNVTFSGNSAGFGGGMSNATASPTLANVTFSGNSATNTGGGMYNEYSSAILTNVTFSGNSATNTGGGMENHITSYPIIENTIFWDNTAPGGGAQIHNNNQSGIPILDSHPILRYSVVQGGCQWGSTCTNLITANPLLGPLGDYGGSTLTTPLLPGSSAIDAGNDATCASIDQRGIARPQGAHCDIGAYESQGFTLIVSGGNNQSAARNTSFAHQLSVTVAPLTVGEPVDGGQVIFTAPASGASAVISGSPATISSGAASVTATANNILGAYNVSASTTGASPVSFSLENINRPVYTIFLSLILR